MRSKPAKSVDNLATLWQLKHAAPTVLQVHALSEIVWSLTTDVNVNEKFYVQIMHECRQAATKWHSTYTA